MSFFATSRKSGIKASEDVDPIGHAERETGQPGCRDQLWDRVGIETRRFNTRIQNVKQGHSWWYRIPCSKVHSQETCNYDYYDYDADDVKNVHCALRRRHARLQRESQRCNLEVCMLTERRLSKIAHSVSHTSHTASADCQAPRSPPFNSKADKRQFHNVSDPVLNL